MEIRINRSQLSDIAWKSIFEHAHAHTFEKLPDLIRQSNSLENLRRHAKYNTGSITTSAIWALFAATFYFRPNTIFEVGTFIGKSTLAMATALDIVHPDGGQIFTCDFSNDIPLGLDVQTLVEQFPEQSSTMMFTALASRGRQCDLLVLDGRLQAEDYAVLPSLLHSKSVIALDDFEGTEKGAINAIHLMNSLHESHLLIYPPTRAILQSHALVESCTLGLIIPRSMVQFTNQ